MMDIEKKLAATDLNKYKKDELKSLLEECYKYQKFKSNVFVEKSNSKFHPTIIKNCFFAVKSYLKTHVKPKNLSHKSCEIIDNLVLTCYPTLQPSEQDAGRTYTMRKRRQHQNPSPTPVATVEPPKYTEQIPPQYGVWDGETIKLLSNKDVCEGYIKCYKEFSLGKPLLLVKVELETVEI